MIVLPLAFDKWATVEHLGDQQRRAYVAEELRRLDADGAPLLTVALAQADDAVRHLAVTALRDNADGEGRAIYDHARQWMLALVEGETPPDRDAQGRLLPSDKRGKVLKTKVGNLGGNLGRQADAREVTRWSGVNRQARDRAGGDLYVYREVTREPQPFTFDDAVAILSKWGIGVAARQYARATSWRPGGDFDESTKGQCNWLVEECTPKRDTTRAGKAA